MSYEEIPGFVDETEAFGETTVVVEVERIAEASVYVRDELGFALLSDLSGADYLGWGDKGVAGYWGSTPGSPNGARDLNAPGSQGLQSLPEPKPKRFAVNYHVLAMKPEPRRLRLKVWIDDGEAVPSVVSVWPTADWHEREAWDMLGIPFDGHPNLVRILMEDDWDGHPLRKDYPLGGEPVRFSDAE
jgi:NADH:ubiquinone oxidoreductase subunit C